MSRSHPQLKAEQSDMDSFFDFTRGSNQSPVSGSASKTDIHAAPYEKEERQHFNGPSHDYGQFKQQVGLPVGSLNNMPQMTNSHVMFDGFNSGIGEMDFNTSDFGWNSGVDMDGDMGMDMTSAQPVPAMYFPSPASPANHFVDPNSLGAPEEPPSNVGRLWPGMHSQQAQQVAMQKAAQAQAVHQRQMKMQAQQAQYRQVANVPQPNPAGPVHQANGKRAAHPAEPHVEESISRLLSQMRQNSMAGGDDADSPGGLLPHIARMKKDEEDMDEDERLLASEEGKKLSSKERRQLRNKVSARAFRSRRKEYITQLEGEVAVKSQESNTLRNENQALMQENERYRGLIETLLRHPAFTPFINDISKDPSVLGVVPPPQQQQAPSTATSQPTPQPTRQQQVPVQDAKPDYMNFDASQIQVPQQQAEQQQQQQIGLAMVPENDFSKLNINGFNSMNFNGYSVNAYAADIPYGPNPADLLSESSLALARAVSTDMSTNSTSIHNGQHVAMQHLLARLDAAARRIA